MFLFSMLSATNATGLLWGLKFFIVMNDLLETIFLTPKDLKEKFFFPKGNIDHMTLTKNQNFNKRTFSSNPDSNFYQYFNHENIYYCGAASFPCGSVAGTPGYICSKQIVEKYS